MTSAATATEYAFIPKLLQILRADVCAQVFGDIMIDYTYVECTSASVTALAAFAAEYPSHRTREVQASIKRGGNFIRDYQRSDGEQ